MAIAGFEWLIVGGIREVPGSTSGDDELLIKTARRLGISTQGKSSNQIREELLTKADRGQN